MSPKRPNFEIKVGLFVIIGLAIFMTFVLRIEDLRLFKAGYQVHTVFNYVSGLELGAPVNLSGVEVGEVKQMEIFYNKELDKTQVDITVWVNGGTVIRENSIAKIKTLGLLGEKCIELTPGSVENEPLADGGVLFGQDPIAVEDVIEVIYRAANDLDETIISLNSVIGDYSVRDALKNSIKNFDSASARANSVLIKIDEGQGTIGRLIGEDKIYRDLEALVEDIRKHPWKLLHKTKEKEEDTKEKESDKKTSPKEGSVFF